MPGKRKQHLQCASERTSKRQRSLRANQSVGLSRMRLDLASDRAAFGATWRILREAGWTSKPPSRNSLSDLYRYIPPNGDVNGTEGDDFFLGERSLLENYRRTVSVRNPTSDKEGSNLTGCGNPSAEVVARTIFSEQRIVCDLDRNLTAPSDILGDAGDIIAKRVLAHGDGSAESPGDTSLSSRVADFTDSLGGERVGLTRDRSKRQRKVVPLADTLNGGEFVSDGTNNVDVSDSTIASQTIPASDLPDSLAAIPDHLLMSESIRSGKPTAVNGHTRCAVCTNECSTERNCTWCKTFIHHFCSHDVCASLKLPAPDGGFLEDFGDSSYCSGLCYTNATGLNLDTSKNGDQRHGILNQATNMQRDGVSTFGPSVVSPLAQHTTRPMAATKPKQKRRVKPKQSALCSIRSVSQAAKPTQKGKAPLRDRSKKQNKAAAMKEELTRRTRSAAETFVGASVAFSPADEKWMPLRYYPDVGSTYLTGVVTRYSMAFEKNADNIGVPLATFEVQWTCTGFQSKDHVHSVSEDVVLRGVRQFAKAHRGELHFGESWTALCNMIPKLSNITALTDEFEEMDEENYREWSAFRGRKELQIALSPAEVEQIESMTFSPTASIGQPPGLFTHPDGSSTTKLNQESQHLFGHSATSAFFAFLPLSFWSQVVVCTNGYADATGSPSSRPVTLDELMKFLGILWYMTLVDKGEMRNYWVDDEEATIFPGARATGLESIITWRRFIYIRRNLSFRSAVTTANLQRDPAARIRPLISILKSRCLRHVDVGRNVAVDEASIACRSRYARHIIVFNPQKPTGKYHFKLYACCCSTSWYVVSFKLHCSSELGDRMDGVLPRQQILQHADLTAKSSEVRSHVMEVTASLKGSSRIVNTDNFYTSCLLLESLRSIGLYGRGTVRSSSKHFPHFTMIRKKDDKSRGFMKQGVCLANHIVAASWIDGSIVNVVSNADASNLSAVYRRIKDEQVAFTAPTCIGEYNSAMQGVDRHDQLRGRFSLADGHSFQKWHKKLAMAMIDIARCNAYICDGLARDSSDASRDSNDQSRSRSRDSHRAFVTALVRELFNGDWKKCIDSDCGMVYTTSTAEVTMSIPTSNTSAPVTPADPPPMCVAKESWMVLLGRSRSKRKCTVCKFECRNATQKTDYCETHGVALCKRSYPVDPTKPHLCQQPAWTCWQKYHLFYLPKQVYTIDGNLKRTSAIYKAQQRFLKERQDQQKSDADNEA